MQRTDARLVFLLAALLPGASACCIPLAPELAPVARQPKPRPDWTLRGSSIDGGPRKVWYGVGVISGMHNQALARTTADNRARSEIGKLFSAYTVALVRDYLTTITAGDDDAGDSDQEEYLNIDEMRTFITAVMATITVAEHWVDDDAGTDTPDWYALARLTLDDALAALAQVPELNPHVRAYIAANAVRQFDRQAAEAAHPPAAGTTAAAMPGPDPCQPACDMEDMMRGDGIGSSDTPRPAQTNAALPAWDLERLAADVRSRLCLDRGASDVFVLAWETIEDRRPLRNDYALAAARYRDASAQQECWALIYLYRHSWNDWWNVPFREHDLVPPFVRQARRPTNADIYRLLRHFGWHWQSDDDWALLDGNVVNETWQTVTGQAPTRLMPAGIQKPTGGLAR